MSRLPRDLHPVAWWLWATGLAGAASLTTNPLLSLSIIGVAGLVVARRRSDQPWAGAFRLYLMLGLLIVVLRVAFRLLLGGGDGGQVWFRLPEIPLPDWVLGIRLLGPVTRESVLAGLYDGLRLAAIVVCFGAANALANPKRLLKSMPSALYEIGTALVVSITVLPQLADSVRRVHAAQALRGGPTGRIVRLRRILVPVLEDAFERSLRLAAGMDARGYGRTGDLTPRQRARTGSLMLLGLFGICVGSYAVLDQTAPRWLAGPMLGVGVLCAALGLWSAGRLVRRTRYRPDVWQWPELLVAASGLAAGAVVFALGRSDLGAVHPGVTVAPQLSVLGVVAMMIALVPAAVAPPPVLLSAAGTRSTAPEPRPTSVAPLAVDPTRRTLAEPVAEAVG
jgi:energy-coupling factor transport system permease protein